MDAFYASVEQRDNPTYRGKPLAVGGNPDGRGVVAAASYEARRFGVRSAMASSIAVKLCPELILVRPRFEHYRDISQTIMSIFERYSDLVEPLSLDEAYIDVTKNSLGTPFAREVARAIKEDIQKETTLTASAGCASTKFLAKIASALRKPDGLTTIPPEKVDAFLSTLAVRKVPGIGRVTEERLFKMGIHTVGQLREVSETELIRDFGKLGSWFYRLSRGIDEREVQADRERKSLGAERTFSSNILDFHELEDRLIDLAQEVSERAQKRELHGRTLTLKVKYADFQQHTRSLTTEQTMSDFEDLYKRGVALLTQTEAGARPTRLLGLTLSNFGYGSGMQLSFPLFEEKVG